MCIVIVYIKRITLYQTDTWCS